MNQEKNAGARIIILFFAIFLVGIGFSIIMPILPYYAESMGASAFQLGLLMMVYALCQFAFAPFWGAYSDKVGRKPLLIVGLIGISLTFILFALSTSLWMLFAARIAGGILSCATMPAAMAYVADSTSLEKRGKSMGLIGASMGMGMVFGPAIGGLLSHISLSLPFLVAGSLAAVNCLAVLLFLKESLPSKNRIQSVKVKRAPLLKGLSSPLMLFFILMLLASIGESTNHGTCALFAEGKLGIGVADIGWVYTCAGIVAVFVQGIVVGRMIERYGEETTVKTGLAIMIFSFVLALNAFNLITLMVFMAVFSLGGGLIRPALTTAVSKRAKTQQGTTLGILQGYDSLGRAIGPALGGFLLDININYAYISAVFFSVLALSVLLLDGRREVAEEECPGLIE